MTWRKDLVVEGADGQLKLNLIWKDKTKVKLRVTPDRLIVKNFFTKPLEITYEGIETAVLLSTKMAFVEFYVLWVVHEHGSNGISFRKAPFWDQQLPFSVIRENANYSRLEILKSVASSAATGLIGEAAGGLAGSPSVSGQITKKVTSIAVSQVAGDAIDQVAGNSSAKPPRLKAVDSAAKPRLLKAVDSSDKPRLLKAVDSPASPPMLEAVNSSAKPAMLKFVIRRDGKKSKPMTQQMLISIAKQGKLQADDEIEDTFEKTRGSARAIVEKYGK